MVVDALVLAIFGLGWTTDAYFLATTVPLALTPVLTVQAWVVVQPLFIHARENEGEQSGWPVLNLIITTSAVIVFILAAIGALSSTWLIRAQAPGLDAPALTLATRASWVCFLVLPLVCSSTIMQSALNACGSFALPGAAKLIESASRLVFLLMFHRQLGVFALVLGTSVGVLLQLTLFYRALSKWGYRYQWHFSLRHPVFTRSSGMMRYPLISQLAGTGVEIANNALASMIGAGGISALRFATRIIDSLAGLFANSIVVAAAPTLASDLALGDTRKAQGSLRHAVHLLLLVTIPLSMWLAVMGQPLIAFLYERKNFTTDNVHLIASVLMLMIPYIFLSRLLGLTELVFFGRCDTKTPFIGSMLIAVLFIGTSLALFPLLNLYALPIGRSTAYFIGSLLMLYLARRELGGLEFHLLKSSTARILLASTAMAALVLLALRFVESVPLHGFIRQVVSLGVPSLVGGSFLLWALIMLRVVNGASVYSLPGMRWLQMRT